MGKVAEGVEDEEEEEEEQVGEEEEDEKGEVRAGYTAAGMQARP